MGTIPYGLLLTSLCDPPLLFIYFQVNTGVSYSCPLPPKPNFGVWVGEGLSVGCRAGLTLERCSQLAVFATQPIGWDAAAVWLIEDGVPRCAPSPSSNLVPFTRWRQARGREYCRGGSGSALSGKYALDFARAEGLSIVDEPWQC